MAYESITLTAGGAQFSGWTAVSVTAGFPQAVRTFDVQVTEIGAFGPSPFSVWHFPPSTPITLDASGTLLIAGYVDDYDPSGDAQSHNVTIRGRGLNRSFVDSSVKHPTGQFENKTVLQIAQELAAPFGSIIGVAATAIDAASEIVPFFQVRRGSSPWAETMRLLQPRGATLSGQPDGSTHIMRTLTERHAGGLVQGRNIIAMSAHLTDAGKFTDYEILAQQALGIELENIQVLGHASGGAMPDYRFHETVHQTEMDQKRADALAKWTMLNAAGMSRTAEITVPGFRDENGALWYPGNQVFVMAPWLKIEQDMLIHEVNFVQNDQEGTVTKLSLVDPRAGGGDAPLASGSGPVYDVFGGASGGWREGH